MASFGVKSPLLLLLAAHFSALALAFRASSTPLRLDCGAAAGTSGSTMSWSGDQYYDGGLAGVIAAAQANGLSTPETTLRYFPTGQTSCYNVPVASGRYLVRLGFYYGNYDGANQLPVFNVRLQDTLVEVIDIAQVQAKLSTPYYTDYIAFAMGGSLAVCFEPQASASSIYAPFINTLEILPQDTDAYDSDKTGQNVILSNFLRLNMGATTQIGPEPVDPGFRTWLPDVNSTQGNYDVYANAQDITDTSAAPDYLPAPIFQTARMARADTGATGFRMTITPVDRSNRWYLRYYFAELNNDAQLGDRVFNILLGSGSVFNSISDEAQGFDILAQAPKFTALVVPVFFNYTDYAKQYGQDLEVGVKTVPGSKLQAIINAVELYEVIPVGNTDTTSSPPPTSGGGLSTGAIVGIVVGSVVGLLLLVLLALFIRRRAGPSFSALGTHEPAP